MLSHLLKEFLTLGDGVVDSTHVEECLLGKVVDLTVKNHLEATNGLV